MLARSVAGMLLALSLLAAPARADAPFTVGNGGTPDIAMEAGGVAHIVYREPTAGNQYNVKYCRVPPGAKACNVSLTLGGPVDLDDPMVAVGGGAVYVAVPHYVGNTLDVYVSGNSGASFSGPVSFSPADPNNNRLAGTDSEDLIFGPGQSLSVTTWNPGEYYLNLPIPLAGGGVSAANFATSFVYNFSVGLSGQTPILAAWQIPGSSPTQFATWSPANPGALNTAASWTGPTAAGQGEDTALAGGPRGLYLMNFANGGAAYPSIVQVRRFTGAGFGAPVTLSSGESSNCGSCNDVVQDTSGGLYAVWRGNGSILRLATSSDGGATFTAPSTITEEPQTTIANVHMAAAPGGTGLVVYDDNSDRGRIRVADLRAVPPPPPVLGQAVNVKTVKGVVLIKPPAGKAGTRQAKGTGFVPLTEARQIPVGSILDTRKGTVGLTAAAARVGSTQTGEFTAGIFQVLQNRRLRGLTDLRLSSGSFSRCGKTASAAKRKRVSRALVRKLLGNAKGKFRTRGRFAAATVRGTQWGTYDRCDGTVVRVRRGVVVVRDLRRRKSITVRAGKSVLVRRP